MLWLPDLEFYNAQDYDEGYFPDSFLRKENHLAIVYSFGNMVHYISQTNLKVIRDILLKEISTNILLCHNF